MTTPSVTSAPTTAPSTPSAPTNSAPPATPAKPSAPATGSSGNAPAAGKSPSFGKSAADIAASAVAAATGDAKAPTGTPQEGAPEAAAAKAPEQPAEQRKFKIKVNGVEREVTEEQAIRYAQMGYGAQEKFQEAATLRKQVEQALEAMKTDPFGVLSQLGVDVDSIAEERLAKRMQRDLLTPEQRELEELREWRKQNQETEQQTRQQAEEQKKQAVFREQMQRAAKQYDTDISQALAAANLPRIPEAVRDVAAKLLAAREHGVDMDVNTAVEMVREADHARLQAYVGKLAGKQLLDFLGEHVVKELRKHDLEMIRARRAGKIDVPQSAAGDPTPSAPQAPAPARPAGDQKLKTAEWMEMIRKKAGV